MAEGIEEGSIYPIEEMDRREKGTTETNGSEQRAGTTETNWSEQKVQLK